ncbi:MAG: hypothetical protein EOP56_07215 [Sphingobacteriales bacterium]|nr:MAG: hypothetical protein EOP56_07215 [Sphingobacteriales bacterium]
MSKCQMTIQLTDGTDLFLDKAKTAMGRAGGTLTGDTTSGNFHISTPMGKVAGNYSIAGSQVTINITDKPMLVGCGMIESMLRSQLS